MRRLGHVMRHPAQFRRRAIVVGGSLGGMNAALWLLDAGLEVDIFERASAVMSDRGTGIVLNPATVRYLTSHTHMRVKDIGAAAHWFRYLSPDGTLAYEAPSQYRFSSYSALYRALLELCGEDRYHWSEECCGCAEDASGIEVRFTSGRVEQCDLLVFADGIASLGRRLLLPDIEPRYAGYAAWRGTVRESELSDESFVALEEAITYAVLPHSHALSYPIPNADGVVEPGHRLINWLWYRNIAPDDGLYDHLSGRDDGRIRASVPADMIPRDRLRKLVEEAAVLPPAIHDMIASTEHPFIQVVFDLEVPRMAFGRICLLGDAAFTARPHAAAGTAKAAEDAWKLGEAVKATDGDIPSALRPWEIEQLALGRQLVARSRAAGERLQSGQWRVGDPLSFGLYAAGDSAFPP